MFNVVYLRPPITVKQSDAAMIADRSSAGLGSAMAETMAEAGVGKRLRRLGLQDTYAHGASREYLMRKHGIDKRALLSAIESMVGRRSGTMPPRRR